LAAARRIGAIWYKGGMIFGRKPKLPITGEQKDWVDRSFLRLANILGVQRTLDAVVILPTPEYFPDRYDGSETALQNLFGRVATAMHVNPTDIDVTLFSSGYETTRDLVPFYSGSHSGAGGLYFHDVTRRPHISVNEVQLKDPTSLVAVLAHEIGHVILLRPGLVQGEEADMEPLNDLLMVFLGLGVFTANAAFQFQQFSDNQQQGWSTNRLGYLSEEFLGYALARFAFERGETKPVWAAYLSTNVATYFKRSLGWLTVTREMHLFSVRIPDKT
jgi:hypothetical protein